MSFQIFDTVGKPVTVRRSYSITNALTRKIIIFIISEMPSTTRPELADAQALHEAVESAHERPSQTNDDILSQPSSNIPYRQIRALYDDDTITVYQAYSAAIAIPAFRNQKLCTSPDFKLGRMTWIKPSWCWMM